MENETTNAVKKCVFCSQIHEGKCPIVKSVEYYPNGTIKKIEYITNREIDEVVELPDRMVYLCRKEDSNCYHNPNKTV